VYRQTRAETLLNDRARTKGPSSGDTRKRIGMRTLFRGVLALFFVAAGVAHFRRSSLYAQIVPPYLPHPLALVYVSGVCEILGGCGILIPCVRRIAGWGLIALLIAVFPANIHMALGDVGIREVTIPPWLLWLRLPLQGVFIAWVWWCIREN
jgi:uncharacterized membrane protein